MKKLNAKGFTLIELLAVVTIMGILMLVAIPAVSRTIENTRRDTFMNTAKEYVSSVSTLWASDGIVCKNGAGDEKYPSQAIDGDIFYVRIDSKYAGKDQDSSGNSFGYFVPVLLEKGGKSSWSSSEVTGYVQVYAKSETAGAGGRTRIVPHYYVAMVDTEKHGISENYVKDAASETEAGELKRKHVVIDTTKTNIPLPTLASTDTTKFICEEA